MTPVIHYQEYITTWLTVRVYLLHPCHSPNSSHNGRRDVICSPLSTETSQLLSHHRTQLLATSSIRYAHGVSWWTWVCTMSSLYMRLRLVNTAKVMLTCWPVATQCSNQWNSYVLIIVICWNRVLYGEYKTFLPLSSNAIQVCVCVQLPLKL